MAPTSTLYTHCSFLFPPCELPWPFLRWTVCLQFCGCWIYVDLWDGYLIHPSYQSEDSETCKYTRLWSLPYSYPWSVNQS